MQILITFSCIVNSFFLNFQISIEFWYVIYKYHSDLFFYLQKLLEERAEEISRKAKENREKHLKERLKYI